MVVKRSDDDWVLETFICQMPEPSRASHVEGVDPFSAETQLEER